eukprot:6179750-Pleurochrysis_carterae.AAC.2
MFNACFSLASYADVYADFYPGLDAAAMVRARVHADVRARARAHTHGRPYIRTHEHAPPHGDAHARNCVRARAAARAKHVRVQAFAFVHQQAFAHSIDILQRRPGCLRPSARARGSKLQPRLPEAGSPAFRNAHA